MKSFANKEINYSLNNPENYRKELDSEITDVVEKLGDLFVQYFKFITENIKIKNTQFTRFIIIRGLDTISNVFNNILLNTKNLDLTYFHSQKAFYLYVEFIGQISEDEKMFLQLSSRDATTYVYKKTIFDMNNDYKKTNEVLTDYTRLKISIINNYTHLYEILLTKIINDITIDVSKINDIEKLYKKLNDLPNKSHIKIISDIIHKFSDKINDAQKFLDICSLLIKKCVKNPNLLGINFLNKFLSQDFAHKIQESPDKFIGWFMS